MSRPAVIAVNPPLVGDCLRAPDTFDHFHLHDDPNIDADAKAALSRIVSAAKIAGTWVAVDMQIVAINLQDPTYHPLIHSIAWYRMHSRGSAVIRCFNALRSLGLITVDTSREAMAVPTQALADLLTGGR